MQLKMGFKLKLHISNASFFIFVYQLLLFYCTVMRFLVPFSSCNFIIIIISNRTNDYFYQPFEYCRHGYYLYYLPCLSQANNTMLVNSIRVPESDIMATNGVIHFVDNVLYPGGIISLHPFNLKSVRRDSICTLQFFKKQTTVDILHF